MSKKVEVKKEINDTKLVIGEVVESFVKTEDAELSQEEEIQKFQLKKEKERIFENITEEERKKREEEEKEEEEKLKKQKAELLISLKERIPAIEKKIYGGRGNSTKKSSFKVKEEKNIQPEKIIEKSDKINDKSEGYEREL